MDWGRVGVGDTYPVWHVLYVGLPSSLRRAPGRCYPVALTAGGRALTGPTQH